MSDTCSICGAVMTGIAFVDGRNADGTAWGRIQAFCEPCEAAKYPYPQLEAERKARIAKRLSQRDAASALDITLVQLSRYESGRELAPPELIDRMHDL